MLEEFEDFIDYTLSELEAEFFVENESNKKCLILRNSDHLYAFLRDSGKSIPTCPYARMLPINVKAHTFCYTKGDILCLNAEEIEAQPNKTLAFNYNSHWRECGFNGGVNIDAEGNIKTACRGNLEIMLKKV